jgi:hypothetical protein
MKAACRWQPHPINPAVHSQNIIRLRTMSLAQYRIAKSSWRDGSFDGFLQCGRDSASTVTSCWNSSSYAISLRRRSEQAHGGHASARMSGCSGCSSLYRQPPTCAGTSSRRQSPPRPRRAPGLANELRVAQVKSDRVRSVAEGDCRPVDHFPARN